MSKQLRSRLVRNTITTVVSILRATVETDEDHRYPSEEEMPVMAKRLVEKYHMLQDQPSGITHRWVTMSILIKEHFTSYLTSFNGGKCIQAYFRKSIM